MAQEKGSRGRKFSSRLTLRAGIWYAGEVRCSGYAEALKKTLQAAELDLPEPEKKPQRMRAKKSLRLELRPWWQLFLKVRAAREEARRAATA